MWTWDSDSDTALRTVQNMLKLPDSGVADALTLLALLTNCSGYVGMTVNGANEMAMSNYLQCPSK